MLRLSGSAQCLPAAPNGSSQGPAPCLPGAQRAPLGTAAYLLVQPQELAVAHSAVQHPVHVDVVGLQGETSVRSQHPPNGRASGPAQLRAHRPTRQKPLQAPARHRPGRGDAPEDPTKGQMGHPQPSPPPDSRAQLLPQEALGPTWQPRMPRAGLGTTAGAGLAL